MANEIQATGGVSASTYYAWVWHQGQIYNTGTSALEAFNSAHWANYAIAMSEDTPSGDFFGTMPALPAGLYSLEVHLQLGGSPAIGDISQGSVPMIWNGTAEVNLSQALGTDGEVLVSTDTHTSGLTIAAVEQDLGTVEVGSYAAGMDPASQVLEFPSRKLFTDTQGGVLVGDYETGKDPGSMVLLYPNFRLATNAQGYVIATNVPSPVNPFVPSFTGLPTAASNNPAVQPISLIRESGVIATVTLSMSGFPLNLNIGDIRILFRIVPSTMTGTELEPIPPPPLLQKDNLLIGGITILDALNGIVAITFTANDFSDGDDFPEGVPQPYDIWVYASSVGLASPALVGNLTVTSL